MGPKYNSHQQQELTHECVLKWSQVEVGHDITHVLIQTVQRLLIARPSVVATAEALLLCRAASTKANGLEKGSPGCSLLGSREFSPTPGKDGDRLGRA